MLYQIKEGATKHLKEKGYWLKDWDDLEIDLLVGEIVSDYSYVDEYPHVGFKPLYAEMEIGISKDWLKELVK